MQTWQKAVCINVAACVALLCLLLPATAQTGEKTGIYVAPKFNVGFMNWQPGFDADAQSGTWNMTTTASSSNYGAGTRKVGPFARGGAGSFDFSSGQNSTLWGGALAVGYDFYPRFDLPLRLELEYGIYSNASDSNDYTMSPQLIGQIIGDGKNAGRSVVMRDIDIKLQNIQTLLLNAYWDFHNSTNFTPYIGAGLGLAFIQAQGSGTAYFSESNGHHNGLYPLDLGIKNNTNFAWQVGAGCSYAFTDTIALDLGYRFMGLGNVKTNSVSRTDVYAPSHLRIINMRGTGEAKDIYMHQVNLGLRISF